MNNLPYEILIVNDRIRLVQLKLENAERVFWLTDTNREYLARYLPWVDKTLSAKDSADFISLMIDRRKKGEEYGYGIEYDGEIVGHTSLMHLKDKKIPEIGYWIASSHQGKGIVSAIARTLTDLALLTLGREQVIIRAEPSNLASNRVAEKCGYHRDGQIEEDGKVLNIWKKSR